MLCQLRAKLSSGKLRPKSSKTRRKSSVAISFVNRKRRRKTIRNIGLSYFFRVIKISFA